MEKENYLFGSFFDDISTAFIDSIAPAGHSNFSTG